MVFLTTGQRFEQVFGPFGILHFISPFLPFECPKIDEGYRRIITYNSDCVVNGVVVASNDYNHQSLALSGNTERSDPETFSLLNHNTDTDYLLDRQSQLT